jgi:hypothetical protein
MGKIADDQRRYTDNIERKSQSVDGWRVGGIPDGIHSDDLEAKDGWRDSRDPTLSAKDAERVGASVGQRFRFDIDTLRHWEQGRRIPEGPTRAYLLVIDREPQAVQKALRIA